MSLNRRELLSGASRLFLARFAAPQLLAWAATGLARRSWAQQGSDWSYVNIHTFGGPNRWVFDQLMQARESDPMVPNPHVVTAFSSGVPTYQTAEGPYPLPHLWQLDVARSDGSRRPMRDLLANMAIVRGYTTNVDGHTTNWGKQTQPLPGSVSLGGLVADAFTKSVAAIGLAAVTGYTGVGFRSAKGLAQTQLHQPTALARELMTPFDASTYSVSSGLHSAQHRSRPALERAAAALMSHAKARDPGAAALGESLSGATKLIAQGVDDLDTYWPAAVARYTAAIEQSMRPQVLYPNGLPGVTVDLATGAQMTSDGSPKWGIISDKVHVVDAGVTVASLLANVTITYLADYLALAEYALVKRLTSSIEMPIGFVDGLTLPGGPLSAAADEHGTGEAGLIAVDSAYYRGLGAGLLELIDALKRHGLFDHTLIHYTGDFSRTPRDGMSDGAHGSDHGFDACVTSFYSGAIDGPVLVGNIALNPSSTYSAAYPGTWGLAAPIAELGAPPGPAHVASSIAAIMGIARHPWTAAVPLLKVDSGKVVPNVEQPRTVT